MFKKMMMFVLLSLISTAPIAVLAEVGGTAQIRIAVKVASAGKIADTTPVIRLASNDIVQAQEAVARNVANKNTVTEKPAAEISKIPPQTWLVLTALFCFVMRSSRRVV